MKVPSKRNFIDGLYSEKEIVKFENPAILEGYMSLENFANIQPLRTFNRNDQKDI